MHEFLFELSSFFKFTVTELVFRHKLIWLPFQGTYIYFDYEKWGQRKKVLFSFAYQNIFFKYNNFFCICIWTVF
jgi:hypothetical protein